MNVRLLFFVLIWGWSLTAAAAESPVSVDAMLQKASRALQEENYQGRLTYEFGTVLETLEVAHAVKDGVEMERIHHLSGIEREFIRSGRQADCVTVGTYLLRGGLAGAEGNSAALSKNYHFYIRGDDRIAGRKASIVQLVPKDEYRYGMTLALDKESGLPLMSLVTAGEKNALERFQFVHLDVDVPVDEMNFSPSNAHVLQLDGEKTRCSSRPRPQSASQWQVDWLPAGFLLSESGEHEQHGDYLTFTDGLSSFTVFVSPIEENEPVKQGVARRGATVALMSALSSTNKPYSVILVGEVPVGTAQRVVASVTRQTQAKNP